MRCALRLRRLYYCIVRSFNPKKLAAVMDLNKQCKYWRQRIVSRYIVFVDLFSKEIVEAPKSSSIKTHPSTMQYARRVLALGPKVCFIVCSAVIHAVLVVHVPWYWASTSTSPCSSLLGASWFIGTSPHLVLAAASADGMALYSA